MEMIIAVLLFYISNFHFPTQNKSVDEVPVQLYFEENEGFDYEERDY